MKKEHLIAGGVVLSLVLSVVAIAQNSTGDAARLKTIEQELAKTKAQLDHQRTLNARVLKMEQRLALLERGVPSTAKVQNGVVVNKEGEPLVKGAPPTTPQLTAMEQAISKRVNEELEAKLTKITSRRRNRRGEWRAPIAELSDELQLSTAQKKATTKIFDEARNDTFAILSQTREDGTSLLDDYASEINKGTPKRRARRKMFRSMYREKPPNSDKTYFESIRGLRSGVMKSLENELSEDQMTKLKNLRIDPMDVKTGYDPVKDYIDSKTKDKQ